MDILLSILSAIIGGLIVGAGWFLALGRKFQIIDDLKAGFERVQQDIRLLIERISKLEGTFAGVTGKGSPVVPTELGAKYIRESGLEKVLNEKKDVLLKMLRDALPKDYADYDVQETARRIFLSLKDDPMMRSVKEYAFQNALDVEIILGAGGLWLRDDFLRVSRGIAKKQV